jgi:hypothetical protein
MMKVLFQRRGRISTVGWKLFRSRGRQRCLPPHAAALKVAHPLVMHGVAAAKKNNRIEQA